MPTLATMEIPKPQSWAEFEKIAQSCLRIKWSSPNLTRNGRHGQAQAGVDIHGLDDLMQSVGVQCKATNNLTETVIGEEIANAEGFTPRLAALYFATTADLDAPTQQKIRLTSQQRVSNGQFPVGIFFWQDLIEELVKNPEEFKVHYPDLALPAAGGTATGSRLLAALEIAYYGLSLNFNIELLFGEYGQMAGEDPLQFQSHLFIIQNCAIVLMDPPNREQLLADTQALHDYVIPYVLGQEDRPDGWRPVSPMAVTIENRIRAFDVRLEGMELNLFTIGKLLSKLSAKMIHDDGIPAAFKTHLQELVTKLDFDPALSQKLDEVYENHKDESSITTGLAPFQLFNVIQRSVLNLQVISS